MTMKGELSDSQRETLNSMLLEYLMNEGVSEKTLYNLQAELEGYCIEEEAETGGSGETGCSTGSTMRLGRSEDQPVLDCDLVRIFKYGTQGALDIFLKKQCAGDPSSFSDELLRVKVQAWSTVRDVKALLEPQVGIPWNEQRLVHGGRELTEDEQCLAAYHISQGNATLLVSRTAANLALSGSSDETIKLWDLTSGECIKTLKGHCDAIAQIVVDWVEMKAVSSAQDNTLKLWDLNSEACLRTFAVLGESHITSLEVNWMDMKALTDTEDGHMSLLDLQTGQWLKSFDNGSDGVAMTVHWPDMRTLFSQERIVEDDIEHLLILYDLESGRTLQTLEGHEGGVNAVVADWNLGRALSGSSDQTLKLWDLESGMCLATYEGHAGEVNCVVADWPATQALSGSDDWTVKVWDLAYGECVQTMKGHTELIWSIDVDWQGMQALSCSEDESLKLWDVSTGECHTEMKGHCGTVLVVVMSSTRDDLSLKVGPEFKRSDSNRSFAYEQLI